MRTVNTKFVDNAQLKEFIQTNKIANNENILLQVFSGVCDIAFLENLTISIKELIPHIKIIGTTTSGEIIGSSTSEYETILSFSIFEHTKVVTHAVEVSEDGSYQTAQNLIELFDKGIKPKVAISFADGLHVNGENYLQAFWAYDKNLTVAGGLAGDNATFINTMVFTQTGVLENGAVVALLYNEELIVNTKAHFGWTNIGKKLTITKVKDNVVYEIDNIKAVDIYAKYLGEDIANELPKTGIEFPLIIQRDGINIARAILAKGEDNSLTFAGNLKAGDRVTFGYGNIDTIFSGENITAKEISTNAIESIFIYSCMARKALLGKNINLELKQLIQIAPVSGFFTYGEFYRNEISSKLELLNQTKTILTLSENKKQINSLSSKSSDSAAMKGSKTLKALSYLISQTSQELEALNETLNEKVKDEVEKNQQKDQQLFQQSRLAQMGEMMSMIAHQWRQPLAAISSTSSAIKLKATLGKLEHSQAIELATKISEFSQHLSATIDDFREFFKPNKERRGSSLDDIVQSVLNIVELPIQNKNIQIIKELNAKNIFETYPNEIKQVVMNLIKNAEDIVLEKEIENPYIKIKSYKKDKSLILEVRDNGGGVPHKILNKIFDPYFSTKKAKDGTGLGLYMSKTIIEEHCDGKLSVRNDENGAIFKIEFIVKEGLNEEHE